MVLKISGNFTSRFEVFDIDFWLYLTFQIDSTDIKKEVRLIFKVFKI